MLTRNSKYLANAWYLAAWSDEVAAGSLLARTLLDVPVVLWRATDGRIGALRDGCPHRFAPLSRGRVSALGIQCGYHGLTFNRLGVCMDNPHGPATEALRVQSYAVCEVHKAVWIWFGDAPADPTLIADLAFLDAAPPTAFSKGYLHSRGNYQLYTDNLMDVSHVDYLHPTTIGSGATTRTKPEILETEAGVTVKWFSEAEALGALLESVLQLHGAPADIWTEVHWSPPAVIRLIHGGVRSGRPREEGVNNLNLHVITPETESSSHYFFAATRNFRLDDSAFNDEVARVRQRIFETEDKPMIEAQHDSMNGSDFWKLGPKLFGIDHGVVRVRRKLEKAIMSQSAV